MLSVRLDPDIEAKLAKFAADVGCTKSALVRQAILEYLRDREDYLIALAVLERQESRTSLVGVRKELGI